MLRARFVHAADLHLDSPFRGLRSTEPHIAQALHRATFAAFDRIIDLCVEQKVDALLAAGDVYDAADRSLPAQSHLLRGLERLHDHGIRSFICHGNHDPLDGWTARLRLPPSCTQFGPEVGAAPLDPGAPERATIYGISYPEREVRRNLTPQFQHDRGRGFGIGLLHANVGGAAEHANYAPCTVEDLERTGMDYWALGHVHTRQVLRAEGPAVVYPGNPQGRHINEPGARGVYIVEAVDGRPPALDFVAVDAVRWEQAAVPIASMTTEQDLLDALEGCAERLAFEADSRAVVCRITLTGRGPLHRSLQRDDFAGQVREVVNGRWSRRVPFVWCERLDDRTAPELDRESRRQAGDFVASVLLLADEWRGDPAALADLRRDLAPLLNHPQARKYLSETPFTDGDLLEALRKAEDRILDALAEAP